MEERSMVAACGWKCPTHRKLGVTAVVVTATGLGAPSDPGADLSTLMTSVTSVVRGDIMHATVALKDQVEAEAGADLTVDLALALMIAALAPPGQDPGLDPNHHDLALTRGPRKLAMENKDNVGSSRCPSAQTIQYMVVYLFCFYPLSSLHFQFHEKLSSLRYGVNHSL
uniref:Uncharacterized protein n=1 Tax=Cacopsylla melanoneura TaxID=428564 RepID=A0A8D8X9P2_9HEMI